MLDKDNSELASEDKAICEARLNYPTARLKESEVIKQYATSCIDVSDGLLQDLGHVLKKSKLSAVIDPIKLPLSASLQKLPQINAAQYALNGGDDYELCFTSNASEAELQAIANKGDVPLCAIGVVVEGSGLRCTKDGVGYDYHHEGYQHFQ